MMDTLKPTSDRKVRFRNKQKNTFGLLPGPTGSCPGATTGRGGCWNKLPGRKTRTCYVDMLMKCYTGIKPFLEHNTNILMKNGDNVKAMVEILDAEFTRFRSAEYRSSRLTGNDPSLFYRMHWSGDIFNTKYAKAIAIAVKKHSDIHFWIYTRTFNVLKHITNIPNLAVYLSLDPVNVLKGLSAYDKLPGKKNGVNLAYMSRENNFEEHKERSTVKSAWLSELKMSICPVDTGKLKLENGCAKCKKCLYAKSSVWFKT